MLFMLMFKYYLLYINYAVDISITTVEARDVFENEQTTAFIGRRGDKGDLGSQL